jgi:AcrR family transcriptional regulator
MTTTPASSSADTRERLLAAAARVFARDGLDGATTREIAREAGLNEVTLFRHFQTKERLLNAVIGSNFNADKTRGHSPPPATTGDLRADLLRHARRYDGMLAESLPLVRTMIGEIHRHGDHERQVFKAIFTPLRDALVARLDAAQVNGEFAGDIDRQILADLFFGMVFTGVLRRASTHIRLNYSQSRYLEAAVDLVLHGAATRAP